MTDRELMQMALDALQEFMGDYGWKSKQEKTWEALRAALAQGEQEPVACIVKGCRNHKHEGHFVGDLCGPCHTFITAGEGKYSQAYRNAQREWQSLTDEEIHSAEGYEEDRKLYRFARAIEARLKEKNGY